MAVKPTKMRPPAPGWINQIQFILSYAFNPCSAPWVLWIDASREPIHDLAVWLITPDLEQIIQSFFTPKGLRSKRHGRKGRRGKGRGVGIPDVDEMIAEKLPGAEEWETRAYRSGTRTLFVFANEIDRVAFSMAIVEKVTETVYSTFLGIISDERANCPPRGTMLRYQNYISNLSHDDWAVFPVTELQYQTGAVFSTNTWVDIPEGLFLVVLASMAGNEDPTPKMVQLGIMSLDLPFEVLATSPQVTVSNSEFKHMMCDVTVQGPGSVSAVSISPDGNTDLVQTQLWVMEMI